MGWPNGHPLTNINNKQHKTNSSFYQLYIITYKNI